MRDRLRNLGDVRVAIKAVALGQLAAGGPAAVSVNAIGRELGVSGPALYRYYPSRDALLTDLIVDAYDALTTAVAVALEDPEPLPAFARAYRGWALAQPHRYRLLYAPPLPGYDAQTGPLVTAAQGAMDVLLAALVTAPANGAPWPPGVSADQLGDWARERGQDADQALRAVLVWSRLHGLAGLEIDGNFASLGVDPAGLYAAEVRSAATGYPAIGRPG